MNKTIFKTLLFLFVLLQWSISPLLAQTYEGNYYIRDSEDMLDFNYTKIEGNLIIENSDLEHFTGFPTLVEITGDLKIIRNQQLQTIDGFDKLQNIANSLIIEHNEDLTTIKGFSALENVGSNIEDNQYFIGQNLELLTIEGFDALVSVPSFIIMLNNELKSIPSYNNLEQTISFKISTNKNLLELVGFDALKLVDDFFTILGNDRLEKVVGFGELEHVGSALSFSSNDALKTIPSFRQLKTIKNTFQVWENSSLTAITGFDALITIKGIDITFNESLQELQGFRNVEEIEGIRINNNVSLSKIDICDHISEINSITIRTNEKLAGIQGFNQLIIIEEGLVIINNLSLEQIDAFKNIQQIKENLEIKNNGLSQITEESFAPLKKVGNLEISDNDNLLVLRGFDQLVEVDKLDIINHNKLEQVEGFNSLISSSWLNIFGNQNLKSIKGFNQVTTFEYWNIARNNVLHEIIGFENLTDISFRIHLTENPKFSDCCFLTRLRLLESLSLQAIDIKDNGAGCNDLADLLASCGDISYPEDSIMPTLETVYKTPNNISTDCSYFWRKPGWGRYVGYWNNFIVYDYLKDNKINLITNAYAAVSGTPHQKGYWYIVEFDAIEKTYKKIYVSELFDVAIDYLALVDMANDGKEELIILTGNVIHVVDLLNLNTIAKKTFHSVIEPTGSKSVVKYADVDQDGISEFFILIDDTLFVLNDALEIKAQYDEMENGRFDIGNVDEDATLEIVFTNGLVYEFKEGNLIKEYDFHEVNTYPRDPVLLEDTDGDGYEEALVLNNQKIVIYDVEMESVKFELEMSENGRNFAMIDVNGDGVKEIVSQYYCYEAKTGELIWKLKNKELRNEWFTSLAVADFDGDGSLEMASGDVGSDRPDYLVIHNIEEDQEEWRNDNNEGPIYDIEVADLDQDGQKEIITFKYVRYKEGAENALVIYDALSKEQKYASSPGKDFHSGEKVDKLFNNYMLEVADYGNDGDMDMIITNYGYNSAIWVIDGDDFSLEATQEIDSIFSSSLYMLSVDDLDQDGNLEIITGYGGNWYVFSLEDLSLKQVSSEITEYGHNGSLQSIDIDEDGDKEVLFCRSNIFRFDANAQLEKESTEKKYTTIEVVDWDNSGDLEIIAGREDGSLHILDVDFNVLDEFQITDKDLEFSDRHIDAIKAIDLFQDGMPDLLITAHGYLYILSNNGERMRSQYLGGDVGRYDAFEIVDYDEDGIPNILLGASSGILELNLSCIECLGFNPSIAIKDASCSLDNGGIRGVDLEANSFLEWDWNNFGDRIESLKEGMYDIQVVNDKGCKAPFNVQINQKHLSLETDIVSTNLCFEDSLSNVVVGVKNGIPPYTYEWSNGMNHNFLHQVEAGDYTVTVSDYSGCTQESKISIIPSPDEIFIYYYFSEYESNGEIYKNVHLDVEGGTGPYEYLWDDGYRDRSRSNTKDNYTATITDANGCQEVVHIVIDNTPTSVPLLDDYTLTTYPNPAIDQLHLAYNGSNPINMIQLVNIQGQEQAIFPIDQVEYVQNDLITLQLPEVQAGIYFLLLQIGEDWYAKKIVVGE